MLIAGINCIGERHGKHIVPAIPDYVGPDWRPLIQRLGDVCAGQQTKVTAKPTGGREIQVGVVGNGLRQDWLWRRIDLLWPNRCVRRLGIIKTVTKLALQIETHAPQAAVGFEEQAVSCPRRYGHDIAGDNHCWPVSAHQAADSKLAWIIVSHEPVNSHPIA